MEFRNTQFHSIDFQRVNQANNTSNSTKPGGRNIQNINQTKHQNHLVFIFIIPDLEQKESTKNRKEKDNV